MGNFPSTRAERAALVVVVWIAFLVMAYFVLKHFFGQEAENYVAASTFNPSKDIYIPGMKADGTIVLTHKFKDINTAIDTAANSIKTDYVAADAATLKAAKGHADYHRNAFATWAYGPNGYAMKKSLGGHMEWWMKNKFDKKYIKNNEKIGIRFDPSWGPGAQRYLAPQPGNNNYRLWWNNNGFKAWRIVK